MMVLAILHGLRPNPKLKSILEGCADLQHLWGTTLHSHNLFSRQFFQPQCVHIRFTHITNMQPKFYLGSAMHHTLDREYSRSRKYFQLTNERLVQAELALRYWHDHDNLYIWAPIPIYTDRVDYRSLEKALIQEWQPRLNFPFICQFYHPKKGLLKKPLLNTNAQFGLATLWRRAKHKFTPQLVRQILTSSRFQNRLELWTIIHALGSNTKARFEQTKMLRSNDKSLTLCYALRRLANNTQEPFRTLSLAAIDASIKWWHGKPAPRASALRAPWSLSPNLQSQLKKFLRQWHFQMLDHQVPCHTPSFKMVFIKHAAVLDILCNHKQAIEDWSTSNPAICCCKSWSCYKSAALNPSAPHWVLSGSLLHSLLPPELAVIAEGSLSNKVFPSKKEYHNQMRLGFRTWTKKNGLPSMPQANISDLCHHLWSEHTQQITNHITKSSINQLQSTFDGAIFHCEDKHASSLRIYCPCLYYQSIESTFQDPSIFEQLPGEPSSIVSSLVESLHRQHGKAYPWAVGSGRQLPSGYILAKRKKEFRSGRPIISFVESPFRPMLNILARLIFQLIPAACPNHFATGDVYTLLSILRSAPVDADLILVNQDLAGFFTSIDQDRFVRSWFMLLDFLRPKMNVSDDEAFSVYPGKSNNPGDIIKGRTFRRLNVTRKIVIKDVPELIKSALNMQTFALGQRCVRQSRGSPMGSPLSPALCLMVVSISEQIWSSTFHQLLSNHHLFIRHIRYVDNRLIFGDKRLTALAPYEVLLDEGFYGKPIILETEPDQEFLGFMLETKPLELIYQGPTNISQVLSPFSASPPKVLLSGFRSCCHIVIKGAFPAFRVQQGLTQLIHLYTRAGFPKEELRTISDQLLIQHQNLQSQSQMWASRLLVMVSLWVFWFWFLFVFLLFSFRFLLLSVVSFLFLVSWQLLGSTSACTFFLAVVFPLMDHAQGRAFHHHLARAIMHLNHLAGLLPFFEPSIEWEDSMPPSHFRLDRSTSRGLHTFVPLPPSSMSPTMVTHGGIPSHMVVNPEPNLRPTTMRPPSYMEGDHTSTTPVEGRNPVLMTDPGPDPTPGNPSSTEPGRGKPRTTIPVPVRSKQRVSSTVDPQPKKRQKLSTLPETPMSMVTGGVTPGPLPITSEVISGALNSDDSDGDAASVAASAHDTEVNYGHRGETTSHVTSTIPPGTSTLTLTPNPKAPASPTFRILQPNPADPPRDPPFRPWTNADDQELISI